MLRRSWRRPDTGLSQPVCISRQLLPVRGLMVKTRVDWLVELAGTSHRRALRRLPPGGNDPCLRFHLQSWLYSSELAGLAADDIDLAYTWVYQ